MPIYCERLRIAYFPVPKVGSSTMRSVLYTINNGLDLDRVDAHRGADKTRPEIRARFHKVAKADRAQRHPDYETLAIVRDPLARFVSGFRNKILDGQLERLENGPVVRDSTLPSRPDIDAFLENFDQYMARSGMLKRHFRPMSFYLGRNLRWFDHVYRLEQFATLEAFLDARIGAKIAFPHKKKKDDRAEITLTPAQQARVREIYRADYALLESPTRSSGKTSGTGARWRKPVRAARQAR
ncbi:hypothetical protein GE300_02080 [Rhodobacteraceae bacterium 2CG4]|uniref:Sulfotransferase family protein n=1 Tax=Halovulum marinum TaxID=2662447 RepID=A0A6L5YXK2_9RHOB|nr:sulfotransferase family 2 domain-containing protein [Halovulum marinum]MSU88404.1 hypothetical protein [Halovulum marinum]